MNRDQIEALSAFIDSELAEGRDQVVDRLLADGELQGRWDRYHLIGDCLRGEAMPLAAGFTEALLRRLDDEPTVLAPVQWRKSPATAPHWSRWATGATIAASVAALVVVGVTRMEQPGSELVQSQSRPEAASAPVALVADRQAGWDVQEPEVASKLNRYLVNHGDFASRGSLNGMVPLATFVSYDE